MTAEKLMNDIKRNYICPLHNYFNKPYIKVENEDIKIFFAGESSERPWIMKTGLHVQSFTDLGIYEKLVEMEKSKNISICYIKI